MNLLHKLANILRLGLFRRAVENLPNEPQAPRLPTEILSVVVAMAVAEHIDCVIRADVNVKVGLLCATHGPDADPELGQSLEERQGEPRRCASANVLRSP